MVPANLKRRISERAPQFGCRLEMFSPIAAKVAAGFEPIVADADVLLLRDRARASLAQLRAAPSHSRTREEVETPSWSFARP